MGSPLPPPLAPTHCRCCVDGLAVHRILDQGIGQVVDDGLVATEVVDRRLDEAALQKGEEFMRCSRRGQALRPTFPAIGLKQISSRTVPSLAAIVAMRSCSCSVTLKNSGVRMPTDGEAPAAPLPLLLQDTPLRQLPPFRAGGRLWNEFWLTM